MSKFQIDSMNGLIDRISYEVIDIEDIEKRDRLLEIVAEMRDRVKEYDNTLYEIAQNIENLRGEL